MEIINILNGLQEIYLANTCIKPNGAKLLGLHEGHTPPYADHVIFAPMSKQQEAYIMESVRLPIPEELLLLFNYSNGLCMYYGIIPIANYSIPFSHFTIYGIPRPRIEVSQMEPFNITIEDLDRSKGTPKQWLKFGAYSSMYDIDNRLDLFVDTSSGKTYSSKNKAPRVKIEHEWLSIDACLCWCFSYLQTQTTPDKLRGI